MFHKLLIKRIREQKEISEIFMLDNLLTVSGVTSNTSPVYTAQIRASG